ncbi:MAG TPA: 30S ribosomal protein S20, partial [Dissulfurispiraceae bacterium]|nr:30S ribosomal protein S20 [Dissulfurispiraceae bacterium]
RESSVTSRHPTRGSHEGGYTLATVKAAPKKNLSGLKRVRQSEKRRLRNQAVASEVRTYAKKIEAAIQAGNKEELQKTLKAAVKVTGGASSKGVIHRNAASRKISSLTRKVNAALAPAPGASSEA